MLRTSIHEEAEEEKAEDVCMLQKVMDVSAHELIHSMRATLEGHMKQINPMPIYNRPLQRQAWGDTQVSWFWFRSQQYIGDSSYLVFPRSLPGRSTQGMG